MSNWGLDKKPTVVENFGTPTPVGLAKYLHRRAGKFLRFFTVFLGNVKDFLGTIMIKN